jgi:hypothetical protein
VAAPQRAGGRTRGGRPLLTGRPTGPLALDTGSVGSKTRTVTVEDKVGHAKSATCSYSVVYQWTGFFQPIDSGGVFNTVNAGRTIPVKFSLGGDQGLAVFSAEPTSVVVACPSASAPQDAVEETSTAVSGLKFDATAGQYIYNWKTLASYANSCRQLNVRLADGTTRTALFKFTK